MSTNEKFPSFRLLILITTPKLANNAAAVFQASDVLMHFQFSVRGTAPSEIMDLLGLGDVAKTMQLAVLPSDHASSLLKKTKKLLKFGTVNSGIGFTLPIQSGTKMLLDVLSNHYPHESTNRKDKEPMNQSSYSLIAAIVDPGYSEEVMNAARSAGAGGGTVFHSRQIANEAALAASGISIQEEKEIVLIVTQEESKKNIMQAISAQCGMHSAAKGHVISIPIESVMGLNEE